MTMSVEQVDDRVEAVGNTPDFIPDYHAQTDVHLSIRRSLRVDDHGHAPWRGRQMQSTLLENICKAGSGPRERSGGGALHLERIAHGVELELEHVEFQG